MHTALEMKGISTKTICTACYHLTIVVFCTIKGECKLNCVKLQ